MELDETVYRAILDALPYEVVFCDRTHTIRWLNRTAKERYGDRVVIGTSIFNCHNENSQNKIKAFLDRADHGETNEMFEAYNNKTGEREWFVPVIREGKVIGYFERHEVPWTKDKADEPVGQYWKRRVNQ